MSNDKLEATFGPGARYPGPLSGLARKILEEENARYKRRAERKKMTLILFRYLVAVLAAFALFLGGVLAEGTGWNQSDWQFWPLLAVLTASSWYVAWLALRR